TIMCMWSATPPLLPLRPQWYDQASLGIMDQLFCMQSRDIVLDIETQNSFQEVGKYDPRLLKISLVGLYDFATDTYQSFLEHELHKMWPLLEHADRLIGYNIDGFDVPVMDTYYPGDLTRFPTLDIMKEIEKKIGFRVKLDDVAQATLGVGKSGSGLMAIEYFRRGEIEKLRDYCLQDVKVTKDVYLYGQERAEVRYNDRAGRPVVVPVNFAPAGTKPALNLTMPF
ncbi:ribonuclease H-like domain-containing protein, partial [Patescibacteria group bacterium]|nr:ribonuclease H-like domain-containing protein [Patescibacteria group bacterium]